MVAEARLKSKNLYKVELYLLKIMPMVIALAYLVNTVSSYFGVDIPIKSRSTQGLRSNPDSRIA